MLDAENVVVAVTGSVHVAPAGTAVPTAVAESLNAAFADVGYISEDGVSTTIGTDTTDIRAWQNGDIVRRVQTSHDYSLSFTMIETNPTSLQLFFGNYSDGAGDDAVVEITGEQDVRRAFVLDIVDGDDLQRIVIPSGQVTERGDVTYANGEPVGYPVTITAYPIDGVKAFIYLETDGAS